MLLITVSGFVDNGKTQFSKSIVSKPLKLDSTHKEKKYKMTIYANIDYVIDLVNERKYMLADTPGHNMLLSTMLSSILISDIHVLVISCLYKDSGLEQMDTYSQIYLALNIKTIIIILTKIDLVTRSIYDEVCKNVKLHFKEFTIYIVPYTNKHPELSIQLFKQYLLSFKSRECDFVPVLKTYNLNQVGTLIHKMSPLIIGYKSKKVLSSNCFLGPVKNMNYEVCPVVLISSHIDENIITAETNLSPYIGSENSKGLILSESEFNLIKSLYLHTKLDIDKTYMLVVKNIETNLKIKSVNKNCTFVILSKPIPSLFINYEGCIIRKAEQKYVFLKSVKMSI